MYDTPELTLIGSATGIVLGGISTLNLDNQTTNDPSPASFSSAGGANDPSPGW